MYIYIIFAGSHKGIELYYSKQCCLFAICCKQ